MTLLELLRQELPKRGGWPEGVNFIAQDNGGITWGFVHEPEKDEDDEWMEILRTGTHKLLGRLLQVSDRATAIVTREKYEAAGWNGEGLPPVGCECEYMNHRNNWSKGTVKYISEHTVLIDDDNVDGEFIAHPLGCNFRPLRTEADKKRDAAIEAIDWYMPECILDTPNESGHAKKIYDAIAAGKIPGVKLEV